MRLFKRIVKNPLRFFDGLSVADHFLDGFGRQTRDIGHFADRIDAFTLLFCALFQQFRFVPLGSSLFGRLLFLRCSLRRLAFNFGVIVGAQRGGLFLRQIVKIKAAFG